jgi:BirA family transcriptional regulator, biotin operon repressor / biotin---[acetyl-CoA-carboxylase] ligase
MPDPLPPEFEEALRASAPRRGRFGDPAYYFAETGSTNDEAAALAEVGAAEGAMVVASAQTRGRGRFGRGWFSPPGAGLYLSLVCRNPVVAPMLTLAGGVAVADGIRAATGLPVHIKWPNDVVVEGGVVARRRKLAGILAEASTGDQGLQYVVLGFGINVTRAALPPELADRATSIEAELGRVPDAAGVLGETLAALGGVVELLSRGERQPVLDRWRRLSPSAIGSAVEWDAASGRRAGATAGIADDGALLVRVDDRIERVISGEVHWR